MVVMCRYFRARDNFELLNRRMKSVAEHVLSLEAEIKQLVSQSKIKFKEMNDIKPELQSKVEIRDQLRQYVYENFGRLSITVIIYCIVCEIFIHFVIRT